TWVDGVQFEVQKNPLRDVVGQWKLKGKGVGGKILDLKSSGSAISGEITLAQAVGKTSKESGSEAKGDSDAESKTSEGDADAAKTAKESSSVTVKPIALVGTRLTGAYRSDTLGKKGISLFSMIVSQDGTANGTITFPDGSTAPLSATMQKPAEEANPNKEDGEWDEIVSPEIKASKDGTHAHAGVTKNNKRSTLPATYPVNYPLGAFGRSVAPEQPKNVLIKNVTIWTLDERGKIENGAVLFGDGWIQSVFAEGDELPKADLVIDGKGAHLTPGIIDCHSHMATDSGVNESGQAITAEVRIGDMIDCDDITIYRQLAGGVTTANILHGSSNPIGGQNQVIKLRWGANEESMKFADAPQGIKFALGENVKRSRSSSNTRYPNTRMGVEQLIDDAFRAAKDYQADWKNWETNRTGLPPRRDLELDTLAEIVDGKRWVHCHSYRQDEILALMRTLEEHNITIGSFQHILEGYKVANEMAKHGAMASAFADWWAYKYEVKDAIPYAGALMHQAGVVVSFNSDDGELARHLNHEAAKAVKYGGVPEVEALKFVTLNPARQLRIEERVGSIEIGKEADMVLWSGHPLSNLSVAQQTWIDGRKYFDRKDDQKLQATTQTMRLTLIQKILESGEDMQRPDKSTIDPAKLWPRYDEFCHGHSHEHDD
ncbi:MAG: imidazolonepropionase-like amidohydrolase, partial [Mariniblastus sp.]